MLDIINEIDEYFHPQSKILRMFSVPGTLFQYEIKDLRSYLWYEDINVKILKIGPYLDKSRRYLQEHFQRKKLNVNGNDNFCNSNLRVILVEDIFDGHGKSFILLDDNNRLVFAGRELVKANGEKIKSEI